MGNTVSDIIPINVIALLPGGMGYFYLLLFSIPISIAIVLIFGYRDLVRSHHESPSENVTTITPLQPYVERKT